MSQSILLLLIFQLLPVFGNLPEKEYCEKTERGWAIEWKLGYKLTWDDFRAKEKGSRGFAVAVTSCGFGYNIEHKENIRTITVFARFYCYESWWNDGIDIPAVLEHEQLHFDICELFGRKLYAGIKQLKSENKLTKKSLNALNDKLHEEYSIMQDLYDAESGHSTDGDMQKAWEDKIRQEIASLDEFEKHSELGIVF
jgi:hypothetical protein